MHRAIAMAEIAGAPVYIVHLSSEDALNEVREARDRGVPAFAETCPQYLLLSIEELSAPGFRRRQVRLHAAAAPQGAPAQTLGRAQARPLASGLHRPLPVLLRRPEDPGQGRFHQDSQRRPGHRESPAADLSPRRERGQALAQSLRGNHLHHARAHFRHVSAQGRNRPRQRRRPGDLGPRARSTPSAPRRITCAWTTPCSKASKSAATPARCFRAAK